MPANPGAGLDAGVIDPRGSWAVQGPADSTPGIAVTDLHHAEMTTIGREFRSRTRERVSS